MGYDNSEVRETPIFRLKRFHIEGYKSLDPIEAEFPGTLIFLIGSNGSGKSSCLQSFAFLQFFATGNPVQFFQERDWLPGDIKSRTAQHNTLRYHLLFSREDGSELLWQFAWGLNSQSSIAELMWFRRSNNDPLNLLFEYHLRKGLNSELSNEIKGLTPKGSITTIISPNSLSSRHVEIAEVVDWACRITSLELLNPASMRGNTRGSAKGIGVRGQRLAGFLADLDAAGKDRIVQRLSDFYPLEGLTTVRKRAGWIDLRIAEQFNIGSVKTAHVSDGFLRLLALCSIPEFGSRCSLVLLDEIEDGIEPHILPKLIERIVSDSNSQFLMTSHSPLLINFFSPREVLLMTRDLDGKAILSSLANLPVVRRGSEYLGGGEIWANTGISTLNSQALTTRVKNRTGPSNFTTQWASGFVGSS